MSEHQKETTFLRRAILYGDGDENRKLEGSIARAQHDERCVQRVASVTALFLVLAVACILYGDILLENFPYDGSELVFRILCEVAVASLICLVALAVLLVVHRWRLNRLREECRHSITRLLESHSGKAHVPTLPGSQRASDNREASQGSMESGFLPTDSLGRTILHGGTNSPSTGLSADVPTTLAEG